MVGDRRPLPSAQGDGAATAGGACRAGWHLLDFAGGCAVARPAQGTRALGNGVCPFQSVDLGRHAGRRFGDLETLRDETAAWSTDVNSTQRGIDWQMKIDDARGKLTSVYPKIKL